MNRTVLKRCKKEGRVLDIRRDHYKVDDFSGVVVGVTKDLVLVHCIGEDLRPNGFAILSSGDITLLRFGTAPIEAWATAVRGQPTPYDLERVTRETVLDDWVAALTSVLGQFPTAAIMMEGIDPRSTYLIRGFRPEGDCLICDKVGLDGRDDGVAILQTENITSVWFASGYQRGLVRNHPVLGSGLI